MPSERQREGSRPVAGVDDGHRFDQVGQLLQVRMPDGDGGAVQRQSPGPAVLARQ